MSHATEIQRRLAWLQTELKALAQLVELELDGKPAATPAITAPAPTPAPAPAPRAFTPAPAPAPAHQDEGERIRWSYRPGTRYRITDSSPFRDGNNFNLFRHLEETYGQREFSREQVGAAARALTADGAINTKLSEDLYCLTFLRIAGAEKGAIEMTYKP